MIDSRSFQNASTGLGRILRGRLAAGRRQLRNLGAMVRAGREMEALLASAGASGTVPRSDWHDLLWRTFEKHGVDLHPGDPYHRDPYHRAPYHRDRDPAPQQREFGVMGTTVEECITLARVELQVARTKLTREIASYPTPIAGCDCQFNYLLAARSKIAVALSALEQETQVPSPKRA